MKRLALTGLKAHKTSRRDLPLVLARKNIVGATTVAGTMVIADKIGIKVFVTGGIGGVHRGAEQSKYYNYISYFFYFCSEIY